MRTAEGTPTRPRSGSSLRVAETSVSSLPDSPMARPPARLIEEAIFLLSEPHSTISAISITSGLVTRSPSTKVDLTPTASSILLI